MVKLNISDMQCTPSMTAEQRSALAPLTTADEVDRCKATLDDTVQIHEQHYRVIEVLFVDGKHRVILELIP